MRYVNTLRIIVLCTLLCVLCSGCRETTEPTVTPTPVAPQQIPVMATHTPTPIPYKEPVDFELSGEAQGTYPGLIGEYESIWEGASPISINRVVKGKGDMSAEYRFFWTESCLYVQVYVMDDTTPDTSGKTYLKQDSVVFYVNEDGNKNKDYAVGDAYYVVNRDGVISYGTGCDMERFQAVTYEAENGYYVEVLIPLVSITGQYDREIGFDVRVNNANKGKLVHALQWSDKSGHTDVNLRGVGTLLLE